MLWSLIAGVIAFILVLVLVVLLLPVTIEVDSVRTGGKVKGSFSINWLMLQIRYALKDRRTEFLIFGRRIVSLSYKEKPFMPEKKRRVFKGIRSIKGFFNLALPLLRLFKGLVRACKLRYLDIDITYGLNDPAHTGILTGFLHAVRGSFRTGQGIRFTPDFTGYVLDWNVRTKVSITPIKIVLPVAKFIFSILKSLSSSSSFANLNILENKLNMWKAKEPR